MRLVLALVAAVVMTACATNPVTGKRELSLHERSSRKFRSGASSTRRCGRKWGCMKTTSCSATCRSSGCASREARSARTCRGALPSLDSPAVNAFALPGGFIYITRGILPYLDNEAQLVGVLGHEIGHVTARHSAQQYTRGMGASLGVLVGSIFVPQMRPFSDLAQGGLGVLFLKFGRDDELQADALGAEYAAGGGWDPGRGAGVSDDARADCGDDRSQRRAELDGDASAAREPRGARRRDGQESARRRRGHVDRRSRRLSRAHRRHRLWRQPGRRHRARQRVSAPAAALCDRISAGMGDHQQRRAGGRAGAGQQSVHGAAHHRAAARPLARSGGAAAHARVGLQADGCHVGDDRRHAGRRRHLRRQRVGHRQSDGARRARRARAQHVLHRRHRAARAVPRVSRAISSGRSSRSGR